MFKKIVIRSNFEKMKPSERAKAIDKYFKELRSQGYNLSYTRNKIGCVYGIGTHGVALYRRISKLIEPLQQRLDNKEFNFAVAETVSFLPNKWQRLVDSIFSENNELHEITLKLFKVFADYEYKNMDGTKNKIQRILIPKNTNKKPKIVRKSDNSKYTSSEYISGGFLPPLRKHS